MCPRSMCGGGSVVAVLAGMVANRFSRSRGVVTIAIWIAEINRFTDPVIGSASNRIAGLDNAPISLSKVISRREAKGEVIKSNRARKTWRAVPILTDNEQPRLIWHCRED